MREPSAEPSLLKLCRGEARNRLNPNLCASRAQSQACKHTEYSLTALGQTLIPIIEQLREWGNGFRPKLEEILDSKSEEE